MSLLGNHLEQISLSSSAIADLPFPPPRIFTNSLLNTPDITALIRDTEAHERALFQIDPAVKPSNPSQRRATRRGTTFQPEPEKKESMASQIYAAKNNRHQSAVARVLGSDMMKEIKRSTGTSTSGPREVNIEVLLKGAEILCNVYPVAGAQEKIASLRYRHDVFAGSIAKLEERVAKNTTELEQMRDSYGDDMDDHEMTSSVKTETPEVTDEDIERELEEIKDLERRKRALEDRVTGMERDLGGLME